MDEFERFVSRATADASLTPYDYQRRLAVEGLPELLIVPTGAGKTLAAVLPWLFRRRAHPEQQVRLGTPRRLVVMLPQRSLASQTFRTVQRYLGNLAADPPVDDWPLVGLHLLMGGASSDDQAWKLDPVGDAVLVGTQDMVLSRLLMRGYGEGRSAWPMSFGLLHADTQFVVDEVQLMGPGLGTSVQVEGLRRKLGMVGCSRTMWMSATVRDEWMAGFPDYPSLLLSSRVELSDADRTGPLRERLEATRLVREMVFSPAQLKTYGRSLAQTVVAAHVRGSRTIVLLNTVSRAREVHGALLRAFSSDRASASPQIVLLHARFRPGDRAAQMQEATADPSPAGSVVVTTQVLEAGVDLSSRTMVTEAAPWSSIVQRAGRCNRAGEQADASLWWVQPPGRDFARPYEEADVGPAIAHLRSCEGQRLTSTQLQQAEVEESAQLYPVLRRQDLLDLFDTSPDLGGNDIDISRWVRDAEERTVGVAWRDLQARPLDDGAPAVHRDEIVQVPVGELRDLLARVRQTSPARGWAWARDSAARTWNRLADREIRPGGIVVLDVGSGGYTPEGGWDPSSVRPVPEIDIPERVPRERESAIPLTLEQHAQDVREAVVAYGNALAAGSGLTPAMWEAATQAGFWHDAGKAHEVFQAALQARLPDGADRSQTWAKSGNHRPLRFAAGREHLRHELASALMLLDDDAGLLAAVEEADLTRYLVAAHHGRIRIALLAVDEADGFVLGVGDGDEVPLPHASTEPVSSAPGPVRLSTRVLRIGGGPGGSWTERACRLRDRSDLGPFRLAFLEAMVRSADWRAGRDHGRTALPGDPDDPACCVQHEHDPSGPGQEALPHPLSAAADVCAHGPADSRPSGTGADA
ncbi:CRISPR-associated endonuclease Cas3'' [Kineosporia sp. J2-2]|uniref:CRISPR-associated endonuclease Cas3 n=1 Tax=Kineosporia corallincola TaxID=2835133 RepID=A0ABS5TTU7_9ACTN|nr:CRISPR-associated endonuclease Cas3'' [Kineosporia corallincola]MBT0774225.1 CRISPR-associated endonuclease Cas3'' [Kineosporia corallincola]